MVAPEQLFDLSEGHRTIQQAARDLAAAVEPFAAEADECPDVHERTAALLREPGLARQVVPPDYGGAADTLGPLAIAAVPEAMLYSAAHLDSLVGMQRVG